MQIIKAHVPQLLVLAHHKSLSLVHEDIDRVAQAPDPLEVG